MDDASILDAWPLVPEAAQEWLIQQYGCEIRQAAFYDPLSPIPPVRVVFLAAPGIVNPGIQFFTHWRYGHCGFLLSSGWILDANISGRSGVWPRRIDPKATRMLVCDLDCNEATRLRIWREAWKLVGTPYDFKWFLGFCVGRDWNDDSKLGCSENVVTACCNSAFPLHDYSRNKPNKITPADVSLSGRLITVYEGPPEGYKP